MVNVGKYTIHLGKLLNFLNLNCFGHCGGDSLAFHHHLGEIPTADLVYV